MAVYFFYGDEDYNIELELNKMISALNPDFKSMSLQVLDNPDFQSLIGALRMTPMMFGDMLVIINCDSYFAANKNTFFMAQLLFRVNINNVSLAVACGESYFLAIKRCIGIHCDN